MYSEGVQVGFVIESLNYFKIRIDFVSWKVGFFNNNPNLYKIRDSKSPVTVTVCVHTRDEKRFLFSI